MINLLLGAPGGGKSYEAVVYHVLVALEKGRKVITNLPLVVAEFEKINERYPALIELRTESKSTREKVVKPATPKEPAETRKFRPFEAVEDYGDPWRHKDGFGPLYVIDECHMCIPRIGTEKSVDEWYAMSRHENADVLLMTQSHGKVCKNIIDLVQVVYRVRKNVALGSMGTYTRKVQDGVRGSVVNESQRKYESEYFPLYKSHTKGKSADELGASDIVPIWKNWSFKLAGVMFVIMVVLIWRNGGIRLMNGVVKSPSQSPVSAPVVVPLTPAELAASPRLPPGTYVDADGRLIKGGVPSPSSIASDPLPSSVVSAASAVTDLEPYDGRGLHVIARLRSKGREVYAFVVSYNGNPDNVIYSEDLRSAGYIVEPVSDCLVRLKYAGNIRYSHCDGPRVSIPGVSSDAVKAQPFGGGSAPPGEGSGAKPQKNQAGPAVTIS